MSAFFFMNIDPALAKLPALIEMQRRRLALDEGR